MDNFNSHILVVDDDNGIRSLVSKYLNENKFLVTTAYSAEDALEKTKAIKKRYNIKIITALTIENINHVNKYELYKDVTDIYLLDGKGYEKSVSFDHSLIENINFGKEMQSVLEYENQSN